MARASVFRTTAFRLTILYLGLFVVSVLAILALIYWLTVPYVEAQADATIDAEIQGLGEQYRQRGMAGLIDIVARRSRLPGSNNIYLLVRPEGSPIVGNLNGWPEAQSTGQGWLHFEITERSGEGRQEARAKAFTLPGGYRLLVGHELSARRAYRRQMEAALTWAALLTIGLGALGGALISRRILLRVEGMNRAITTIMEATEGEALIGRIPVRGTGDEFDQLAETVNGMLGEIELLLSSMRHITEGVAHDLRTPLSRLRSRIELALRQAEGADGYRAALEATMAEADRLLGIFNALLSIATAESAARRENFQPLLLAPLVRDVVDLYEPMAEEIGCRLSLQVKGEAEIVGYGQLLSQAVLNLIDNAVKYAGHQGAVTVAVEAGEGDGGATITVADKGLGIPTEQREAVLRPFVRLESSRNSPGNGLGLSLVAAVARLHRARLMLADNHPGLRVTLTFPSRPTSRSDGNR